MTVKDDLARIERALNMALGYAERGRGGCPQMLHDDLTWSLEALERVRVAWKERPAQVAMFEVQDG